MYKSISIVALSLILVAGPAYAASNNSFGQARKSANADLKSSVQTARETMLEERAELREQIQEGSLEAMAKVGRLHATSLQRRGTFYYQRLLGIHTRLGALLTQAETNYGSTPFTSARTLWNSAKTKLDAAKTELDQAVSDLATVEGDDLEAQRQQVFAGRDQAKLSLNLFRQTNSLLKDTLLAYKKALKTVKPSPSPKPSASVSSAPRVKPSNIPGPITPRIDPKESPIPLDPPNI